jgi:hypothetical protein
MERRPKVQGNLGACPSPEGGASRVAFAATGGGASPPRYLGGFVSEEVPWEDIEPADGPHMVQDLGSDGVAIARAVQPALFEDLKARLPECFEGVDLPPSIQDPFFKVDFLLNIETSDQAIEIADASVFDITYSDEALERCFLDVLQEKQRIAIPAEVTPGRRIRVTFPMSFQIAALAGARP